MVLPDTYGPMKVAKPWNKSRMPNALVNLSKPSRSTRRTEVRQTYEEIVRPNIAAYT